MVFSGTVRDNLDPFGASAGDGAIWAALRQTGMADTITHLVSLPMLLSAVMARWFVLLEHLLHGKSPARDSLRRIDEVLKSVRTTFAA